MIHSYDQDEVISTEEIVKHHDCPLSVYGTVYPFVSTSPVPVCTCTPIRGTRIVIEKWDEYTVKAKEK